MYMYGVHGSMVETLVAGSLPFVVIGFFNCPDPSSCTVALGSTQPLTEMSTRNVRRDEGQPACEADNLTTFF
jgi:hypothetical protein